MAMSSSSSHRYYQPPPPPPPIQGTEGTREEETRNWAELPLDALLAVLRRLDSVDILMGAGHACRPWRRAARGEPELWRRVDMRHHAELAPRVDLEAVARAAVSGGAGRCEAFWADGVGDDKFLFFLARAAPTLKTLRLISCNKISTYKIDEAISKFPLLEELELSLSTSTAAGLEELGKACPRLTRLRLSRDRFRRRRGVDDREATAIAAMHELRSLQLFGNSLGNTGLVPSSTAARVSSPSTSATASTSRWTKRCAPGVPVSRQCGFPTIPWRTTISALTALTWTALEWTQGAC